MHGQGSILQAHSNKQSGYTGEDGFEISIPSENGSSKELASSIAKAILNSESARWAGLAARDSLRLEAGMCLYGHDIDTDVTPPMAGLGWVVAKSRRDNPGKSIHVSLFDMLPDCLSSRTFCRDRQRVSEILTTLGA